MRYFITLCLVLLFNVSFSQIQHLQNKYSDIDIDWSKFEVSMSKIEKEEFIFKFSKLKEFVLHQGEEYKERFLDSYHIVDINRDNSLDIIQYRKKTALGEYLEIHINNNGELKSIYRQFGKILSINRETITSPIHLILFTCINSGHLTYSFDDILILKEEKSNEISVIKESVLLYPENFEFPEKQTISIPFIVKNDKYRLRSEPKIDNVEIKPPYKLGNLIAEFAEGDTGYALAEKKDETGRIWWFVIMDNNIKKDWNVYLHTDHEYENQRNMKVFGWISSRFVEKLN